MSGAPVLRGLLDDLDNMAGERVTRDDEWSRGVICAVDAVRRLVVNELNIIEEDS